MLSKEELEAMVTAEEKRLGVGSEEFMQRHNELMEQIEQLLEESRQRRAVRQIMNVRDVMKVLEVSESKAYGVIRQLNRELAEKGYITIPGKVPAAYFQEKIYGVRIAE